MGRLELWLRAELWRQDLEIQQKNLKHEASAEGALVESWPWQGLSVQGKELGESEG